MTQEQAAESVKVPRTFYLKRKDGMVYLYTTDDFFASAYRAITKLEPPSRMMIALGTKDLRDHGIKRVVTNEEIFRRLGEQDGTSEEETDKLIEELGKGS